jgi:hypothetical protein
MKRHLLLFLIVLLACPTMGLAYVGQAYSNQLGCTGASSVGYVQASYCRIGVPTCIPAPTPPSCSVRPPVCRPSVRPPACQPSVCRPPVRPPACRPTTCRPPTRPPVCRPPVCRPPVRPPVCPPPVCRPPVCPPGGNNINNNVNIVNTNISSNTIVNGVRY